MMASKDLRGGSPLSIRGDAPGSRLPARRLAWAHAGRCWGSLSLQARPPELLSAMLGCRLGGALGVRNHCPVFTRAE